MRVAFDSGEKFLVRIPKSSAGFPGQNEAGFERGLPIKGDPLITDIETETRLRFAPTGRQWYPRRGEHAASS